MTNDKRQAVEERIRELVPELQKLSFGCLVRVKIPHSDIEVVIDKGLGSDDVYTNESGIREKREFEIIGHPIQLHHVLDAMPVMYFVDPTGEFWKKPKGEKLIRIDPCGVQWNLHAPLSGQPDEVWELLYNALIDKA